MSDTLENLRGELESTQRQLAELEAQLEHRESEYRASLEETENNRNALLFMLKGLDDMSKKVEQAHQEWLAALDVVNDAVFLHDSKFRILRANRAYQKLAGMPFCELIGHPYYEIFPKGDAPLPSCLRALEHAGKCEEEEIQVGNSIYRSRAFSVKDKQGRHLHSVHTIEDITERKQSEARLKLFRTLLDNSSDAIEVIDPATLRLFDINETDCRELGYSREELLTMTIPDIDPSFDEDLHKMVETQMRESGSARFEGMHRRKDGTTFPVEVSSKFIELDKPYALSIIRDITERKRTEAAIVHANRALATLSAVNHSMVYAKDEDELLQSICNVIVKQHGYRLAWVGYAKENWSIKIMAYASHNGTMQSTWAEDERGMGPGGHAIQSCEPQVCQDIANDPYCRPWREEAIKHGYASSIALPLLTSKEHGEAFGVLAVYAEEKNAFTTEEVKLLEEMAEDTAFGIRTLRMTIERESLQGAQIQAGERLKRALNGTIQAIALTVEKRDPYTAGHQERVSRLCVAIAADLGLPAEQIEGLRLGAMIHDIGKIYVPAEILNRPGRLTQYEYEIIKSHPLVGHDIMKDIEFPWPIAQMIWQHHERLDGSGYPQGLKGDEIILEARIITVADVVEAMSSHRPYRPALALNGAFSHIQEKRGIYYDPAIVDACFDLFSVKRFQFGE